MDFGHYPENSVNHPLLTTGEGTCTCVRRQMDETEVNDRAESLRRRRKELYRMRMEEKHQKKQKQVRYIHAALHYIKLPLGPRLYHMCISNIYYYFVHIPVSMPFTFYCQARPTMLLASA